ncbi:MAG: pyruvate ferredoxin oxidoreductase [Prevotella sp.]|nr:pyruvate ferredoxin oxidoreductase [Prevotella sp.]
MDYKYIEQLLDRYFQGETTLQEEQILKAFYAQSVDDMPEEVGQYAPLFAALDVQEPGLGSDFDKRMMELTEEATVVPLATTQVKARTISLADRLRPLFGAAAVVAILLTLGNAINASFQQDDTWVDADEYAKRGMQVNTDEPAVAYEQKTDSLAFPRQSKGLSTPADSLAALN